MIIMNSSQNAAGPSLTKRSLFNKPSWSKPQALSTGADLFHRSNQTYVDVAAEAERQRKKKLARKERERARRADSEERAGKRQRVSESEDEDDTSASDEDPNSSRSENTKVSSTKTKVENRNGVVSPPKPKSSPRSLLKHDEASIAARLVLDQKQKPPTSHVINLEDEDENPKTLREKADLEFIPTKLATYPIEDDKSVSDEEFPELARQARERARRKRLEEDMAPATPDALHTSQDQGSQQSERLPQSTPPPPPPSDPILQILITSSIPDTTPLIVNRKLTQRLKDVRLAWTERQHFTADIADKVFLTWRGKRLFDVTSCRSLGLSAGPNGRILATGDNVLDEEGRIHMEAMTAEILEAYKKAKINDPPVEDEGFIQKDALAEQKQEAQIKIICKARGFADFKLIVKPV